MAQSLASRGLAPMLCLPDARHKPTRPLDVDTCFARPCPRCFVCPSRCHDFLVKSAQSLASRGLAPEALSAQLASQTNSSTRCGHLLREALRPMLCLPNSRFNPWPAAGPDPPRPAAVPDNSPADGGARHPPGRRRCQTLPDRRRCKMCKLFLTFGGGGPVSTRHSFCPVSLSRTSHRP